MTLKSLLFGFHPYREDMASEQPSETPVMDASEGDAGSPDAMPEDNGDMGIPSI
jgi:hypothetical protein